MTPAAQSFPEGAPFTGRPADAWRPLLKWYLSLSGAGSSVRSRLQYRVAQRTFACLPPGGGRIPTVAGWQWRPLSLRRSGKTLASDQAAMGWQGRRAVGHTRSDHRSRQRPGSEIEHRPGIVCGCASEKYHRLTLGQRGPGKDLEALHSRRRAAERRSLVRSSNASSLGCTVLPDHSCP